MEKTHRGFCCPKCGYEVHPSIVEMAKVTSSEAEPVYVIKADEEATKVNQICPKCGHSEAFHQVRVALGEHAGVNSDRYVERFKCTNCSHTWVKN